VSLPHVNLRLAFFWPFPFGVNLVHLLESPFFLLFGSPPSPLLSSDSINAEALR